MISFFTRKDLKPSLMEPKATGVAEPYFLIEIDEQVIFVVSPGLNGPEFNKTEGLLSPLQGVQLYQCLYGQGVMLMQRNDEQDEAKEFKVITLSSGKRVVVPAGWISVLVNIGKNVLVVLSNSTGDAKTLHKKSVKEKHGLAYYVVEKKGEVAFGQNPNYSVHPQITTE